MSKIENLFYEVFGQALVINKLVSNTFKHAL